MHFRLQQVVCYICVDQPFRKSLLFNISRDFFESTHSPFALAYSSTSFDLKQRIQSSQDGIPSKTTRVSFTCDRRSGSCGRCWYRCFQHVQAFFRPGNVTGKSRAKTCFPSHGLRESDLGGSTNGQPRYQGAEVQIAWQRSYQWIELGLSVTFP